MPAVHRRSLGRAAGRGPAGPAAPPARRGRACTESPLSLRPPPPLQPSPSTRVTDHSDSQRLEAFLGGRLTVSESDPGARRALSGRQPPAGPIRSALTVAPGRAARHPRGHSRITVSTSSHTSTAAARRPGRLELSYTVTD